MDEGLNAPGNESLGGLPLYSISHHAFTEGGSQSNHDQNGVASLITLIAPAQSVLQAQSGQDPANGSAAVMQRLERAEEEEEDDEEAGHQGGMYLDQEDCDDQMEDEDEEGDEEEGDKEHHHQQQQDEGGGMAASEEHAAAIPDFSDHTGAGGGVWQQMGEGGEAADAVQQAANQEMPPGYACAPFIFNGLLCNFWPASWGPMPLRIHPTFQDRIVKHKVKKRQWTKIQKELILKVLKSNGGNVKGTVAALKREHKELFGSLHARSVAAWAAEQQENGKLSENVRGKSVRLDFEAAVHSLLAYTVCENAGIPATPEELDVKNHPLPIDKMRAKVFIALATAAHGIPYAVVKQKCEDMQGRDQFADDVGVQRLKFSGAYINCLIKRLVTLTEMILDTKKQTKMTRKQKKDEEQANLAQEQQNSHLQQEQDQGHAHHGMPPLVMQAGTSAFSPFPARSPVPMQAGMSPAPSVDASPSLTFATRSAGSAFTAAPGAIQGGAVQGRVSVPGSAFVSSSSDGAGRVTGSAFVPTHSTVPGRFPAPGFALMTPPADGPGRVPGSAFAAPPPSSSTTNLIQRGSCSSAFTAGSSSKFGHHHVHAQHEQQQTRQGHNDVSPLSRSDGSRNLPDTERSEMSVRTPIENSTGLGGVSSTSSACEGVQDTPQAQANSTGNPQPPAGEKSSEGDAPPSPLGGDSSAATSAPSQPHKGGAGRASSQRGPYSKPATVPRELAEQLKMVMPKPRERKTWTLEEKTTVLDALAIHNGNVKRTIKALKMSFGGDFMRLHPRCVSRWLKDVSSEGQMIQRPRGRIVNHEFESEVLEEILSIQKDSIMRQGGRMAKTSITDHAWLASLTHCPSHVVQRAAETVKDREKWQEDARVQALLLSGCWATGLLKRHIPPKKKRKRKVGAEKSTGQGNHAVRDGHQSGGGQECEEEEQQDDENDYEYEDEEWEGEGEEENDEGDDEGVLENADNEEKNEMQIADGGGNDGGEGQPGRGGAEYEGEGFYEAGPVYIGGGLYGGGAVYDAGAGPEGMVELPTTPGQHNIAMSPGGAVYGREPVL